MRRARLLAALALAGCGATPERVAAPAPTPRGTVYLAGREPGTITVLDAAAGTATTHVVPQLTGGDPPYFLAFTGGRLVTFGLGEATSFAPDLSDPRSLGDSWFFVPSATPGRIWNILKAPGTNVRFRGVREVAVDGTTTAERLTRVRGWPLGAVDRGLLVQTHDHLAIWDPVRDSLERVPGTFPLGIRHDLVAACPQFCKAIHFTDGRVIRGPFDDAYGGAFSPDGKLLAVAGERGRIVVIDGNRWHYVPHARTGDYPALAWSTSGWLFYGAGEHRVGAWRPGRPARTLPVHVPKFVSIVTD
jgi:hypothetical protein